MNAKNLELMTNRENLYRLLSRLYVEEVDQLLLEQMKEMNFPVECNNDDLRQGYQLLQEYLKNCGKDTVTDLAVDYAKVFLGAGIAQGLAAFPYESVYTSQKKIIMQEARNQVLVTYAAKGLKKEKERENLPEDHLYLELEFMAYLCQEIQEKKNESEISFCFNEQQDFLHTHLLNWTPTFCADIEKYADTDFYKGIGKITKGFLSFDNIILENLMD